MKIFFLLFIIINFFFSHPSFSQIKHFPNTYSLKWKVYPDSLISAQNLSSYHSKDVSNFEENRNYFLKKEKILKENSNLDSINDWDKLVGPYGGEGRKLYKFKDVLYVLTERELYKFVNNEWISLNFEYYLCNWLTCMYMYDNGRILLGCDWGLYYSDDDGNNWSQFGSDLDNIAVYNILELNNGDLLLCTEKGLYISHAGETGFSLLALQDIRVYTVNIDNNNNIWVGTDSGIYKSSYPNLSWIKLPIEEDGYYKIVFDSRGVVYASSYFNLCRSFDSGLHWDYLGGSIFNDIAIYKDKLLFLGFTHIYLVNDEGIEWESSDSYTYLNNIYINNENEFYIGCLGGACRYNYLNDTFTIFNNSMSSSTINDVFMMNNGELLVCPMGGNSYAFTDIGSTFTQISDKAIWLAKKGNGNTIFATYISSIAKSEDFGRTWNELNINISPYYFSSFDVSNDNLTICAGSSTGEIYISHDGGNTFILKKDTNYIYIDGIKIIDDKRIVALSDSIYMSTNSGLSFTSIPFDKNLYVNDIVMDEDGYMFVAGIDGVYRSTDGVNWSSSSYSDTSYYFQEYVVQLRLDKFDNLYALLWHGSIAVSKDHGQSWKFLTNSIPNTFATRFEVSNDGYFYCGTQSHGLYVADNPILSSIHNEKAISFDYLLFQNYPNPFNPTTTIKYSIPKECLVTIKVYNALGKEISTLINERKGVGSYSVDFNGFNLASGIYFYRMQAGNFLSTKKFLLLK